MRNFIVILAFLSAGCAGVGIYQNPELVNKGSSAFGVGMTYLVITEKFGYILPVPEPYFRYGIGKNQELTVRFPLFNFFPESEGFFFLGGGYRMEVRNFIFSGNLIFYGGSETGALLFEPGVFYRYGSYIGGFQVAGGSLESRLGFPALVRLYFAKSFAWRSEEILPGVQLVYVPESGLSFIMELSLQHKGKFPLLNK